MDPRACSAVPENSDITVSSTVVDPEWDRFVASYEDPHPQQTSGWAQLQELRGWKPFRIIVRKEGSIVGGAQVLERRTSRFGKIGYLNRGPLASTGSDSLREVLVDSKKKSGTSGA